MSKKPRANRYVMPASGNQEQRIVEAFYMLELDGMTPVFKGFSKAALQKHDTYLDFLESLLEAEMSHKEEIRRTSQTTQAKFPFEPTLESYNFSIPRKVDEARIREFASCRFIDNGENIIFVGPTGVGKTHLAIALGKKTIEYGKKVKFFKLDEFIERIEKNFTNELDQQRNLRQSLINLSLLILDDMEYSQLKPEVSDFLYKIIMGRYDKGVSTIFTANESLDRWGSIFGSQIRAEKIADRVYERGHKIVIEGDSYRPGDKLKAKVASISIQSTVSLAS